jgi:alpha-beta hydrolase superfamily lysophospholipase
MPASDSFTLTSEADGMDLFVYRWLPESKPRAIVQIAHGMAEHAQRYAPFAEALVEAGYAVYANDHRGHGSSLRTGEDPGHLADEDGWNHAVADLHQLSDHIRREHPASTRVLFGHSMGSFLVQQMMYEHPTAANAIIMSGSNGKPPPLATLGRGVARIERLRLGKKGQSALINALSFGEYNKAFKPTRTEFDWVSRDESTVDAYISDPLCGFMCSIQSWVDLLDALPALTAPHNLALIPKTMPLYIFSGDRDPVGEMGRGVKRLVESYRGAWLTDVTLKIYEGGRHEMLNETNRDEVTADVLQWLDTVLH